MTLKRLITYKTGILNLVIIIIIAACMGLLSMVSLMSQEQADKIKQHLFAFFIGQYAKLIIVGAIPVLVLLIVNISWQIGTYHKVNTRLLAAIMVQALIAVWTASFIGLSILCCNL